MVWFLAFLCVVLATLLAISLYFLNRCTTIIFNIVESIEESLETLEVSYRNIAEILKTPVGSDDPFIRSVVEEIKRSHDAILFVANILS